MTRFFKMLPVLLVVALFSGAALADGGATAATADAGMGWKGMIGIAAGLSMGIAVFGAAFAQGRLAASAMDGMARNPQAAGDIRTSMLLALAFPESLVLFTLAIAYLLQGHIG